MTVPSSHSISEQTDTSEWAEFVSVPSLSTTNQNLHNSSKSSSSPKKEQEHQNEQEQQIPLPTLAIPTDQPLQGFDTLDDVQRYAIAALTVVLFNRHAKDLNGAAFARTQASLILSALKLSQTQQTALLALDPFQQQQRQDLIQQCVQLVGEPISRERALQAMLALSVASGNYDARSRVFLMGVAYVFQISWPNVAAIEMAIAIQLLNPQQEQQQEQLDDNPSSTIDDSSSSMQPSQDTRNALPRPTSPDFIADPLRSSVTSSSSSSTSTTTQSTHKTVDELLTARRKKKQRARKAAKIGGITLVGGVLFGLTGGLIAPALLTALAGVGVASAAGLAASGTVASGAVVGSLFGVAGAGFTVRKARNRVSTNLEEFDFETSDDPRVITQREKKAERQRRKWEKLIEKRLAEEASANGQLAVESAQSPENENQDNLEENASVQSSAPGVEQDLPRPPPETNIIVDNSDDSDSDSDLSSDERSDVNSSDNTKRDSKDKKKTLRFSFMSGKKHKSKHKGGKKKKLEKKKVGSRGLESASHFPGLHLCICVPAWLTERGYGAALDQFEPGLKQELPCSQHIALRWESRRLFEMGLAFAKFWASKATVTTVQQAYPHAVAAASTVAGAVAFAFSIPLTVMSCLDYIDNPWSLLVSRSNGAGEELADLLVERSYGNRPVSLFGYSIGARVIFKCLESLESRGAFGIVDNVYMMGAAVTADPDRWKRIRRVIAGRIVNAYGSYDWALAFFHRGCGHGVYVSGLRKVELEDVENLNMAYLGVEGHRELKDCVPRVMRAMGLGAGYIIMPPAKLVRRKKRTITHSTTSDSPVCEEPIRQGQSPGSLKDEDISNENEQLQLMTLPKAIGDENTPNTSMELESVSNNTVNGHIHEDAVKKKKQKSWLAWSSWTSSSGQKQKHLKEENTQTNNISPPDDPISSKLESLELENGKDDMGRLPDVPVVNMETSSMSPSIVHESGNEITEELDKESEEIEVEVEPVEEFDWEKQRRIWDEQERQMKERGYADSAIEIEMRDKMILNVSIEVTARRLERFLDQGAQLPTARKEKIFTNCLNDQGGIVIRLYEHESRTRSVSVNMLKYGERYPKLLGEMCVKLQSRANRGKLRVAVGVWATAEGDVCAEVEERFENGEIGDRAEMRVAREELCTIEERNRLEAAERKRVEAQMQQEMRLRAKQEVPALPAPSTSATSTPSSSLRIEKDVNNDLQQ